MKQYLTRLTNRSWRTFLELAVVMIPVMILVRVGEYFGLVAALGPVLEPIMGIMGLPAEAGIIWASTLLVGIYAGFGAFPVLAGLDLNLMQVSILASIMLFAHALPIEQAIVRRTGVTFIGTVMLRFSVAVLYGVIVFWICSSFDLLQGPADLSLFASQAFSEQSNLEFAISSAKAMFVILLIIVVLLVLLDVMDAIGLTERVTQLMIPLIRISGLNREIAPLTTIGVLLGLTFGGGLLIAESREKRFSLRAKTLALSWLSLSHALIEDTGLMMAIGASIWVILVGRIAMTLLVVRLMAFCWPRSADPIASEAASARVS